jgi:membrane associated rhomboid family serine protease
MGSESRLTIKLLALVIVVAVIAAVLATLVQVWILGKSHVAVAGGAVGAISAGLIGAGSRKKFVQK